MSRVVIGNRRVNLNKCYQCGKFLKNTPSSEYEQVTVNGVQVKVCKKHNVPKEG
jgi:hypothetical protein